MSKLRSRVALVNSNREHIRYVPAAFASDLIAAESAIAIPTEGRVREVLLLPLACFTKKVGAPTGACLTGVRFVRRVRLESSSVVEHHPRATDYQRP